MPAATLPLSHFLLAVAVVAVWGSNFVVIKLGLAELPPLAFAALRFFFALVPAVFFLPRPAVPWRHLAAYGVLIGAGQFGLLYIAMNGQISPGLASLVVQVQVFFTIGLAMAATGERVRLFQIAALVLATAGIGVILSHSDRTTTPLGLALVILAAMGWAGGNHVAKLSGRVNMLAYVVWASLFSVPPLVVMSLIMEGWPTVREALVTASPAAWAAVAWQSVGNTLFGYAAWGWLLASALLLGETMPFWKIGAATLVMAGLALNILWPIVAARRLPPPAA
ncbi:MAG: EamA family transporter [Caulobacterales bacterium 32-67-6]|nr:MAG: EamA family transporter [Caulobacterales bacterium 32-67-6]